MPQRGYVPALDVERIAAIDVHVHVQASITGAPADNERLAAMARYFGTAQQPSTVDQIAEIYRARNMGCVVFGVDSSSVNGEELDVSNEEVAERATLHADTVIPFASIDPASGALGVRRARRLIEDHGVRGFKFHPNTQAFYPNDRSVYPLYEVIEEAQLPAMFHTGHSGGGAGERGGGGIRLKYSQPLLLDDVAADFPDLPIIMAHPSFPWQDEAISVALHKPLVHIDLSGWSPKYFSPNLIQYSNTLLRHKVLFGSDFPVLLPDRWLADFEAAPFKAEVRPLILKENAVRLFGLGPDEPAGELTKREASPDGC